jgi:hypothetical protein
MCPAAPIIIRPINYNNKYALVSVGVNCKAITKPTATAVSALVN